jgi:hypothetical protein
MRQKIKNFGYIYFQPTAYMYRTSYWVVHMEEMESVPYITDIANPWVSGAAIFFYKSQKCGEEGKH